jgi:hypothetical protein
MTLHIGLRCVSPSIYGLLGILKADTPGPRASFSKVYRGSGSQVQMAGLANWASSAQSQPCQHATLGPCGGRHCAVQHQGATCCRRTSPRRSRVWQPRPEGLEGSRRSWLPLRWPLFRGRLDSSGNHPSADALPVISPSRIGGGRRLSGPNPQSLLEAEFRTARPLPTSERNRQILRHDCIPPRSYLCCDFP